MYVTSGHEIENRIVDDRNFPIIRDKKSRDVVKQHLDSQSV